MPRIPSRSSKDSPEIVNVPALGSGLNCYWV
jgi:hypothetical protein